MRHKRLLGCGLGCALLLLFSACGGDEAPPEDSKIRRIGKTRDSSTAKPLENLSGARTNTTRITDTKNRKKIEHFRGQLKAAKNSDDRAEILASISEGGKAFKPLASAVRACLKDKDPFVREETLRALAAIDPLGCRPFLEKGLKDEEEDVRRAAVIAWRNAPIKDLSPLFALLQEEVDTEVQRAVGLAVREHGQEYHVNTVVRLMEEVSVSATQPLIEFLVNQKAVKHIGVLAEFLEKSDPSVRVAAAKGLGELGQKSKEVLTVLTRGLADESQRVQLASFNSLKKLTKQDFGFRLDASDEARAKSVSAWKEWVSKIK